MGHDEIEFGPFDRLTKCGSIVRIERRHLPLVDVAGEYLQAFAAGLDGAIDGFGEAAGDRLVGT